jgi:hypothetical protein
LEYEAGGEECDTDFGVLMRRLVLALRPQRLAEEDRGWYSE